MNIQPSRSVFEALAKQGNTVPVYLDLTADCETPLGAYSKIRENGPAFLFESIVGGERVSRFSFLGSNPRKVIRVFADEATITHKSGKVETLKTPEDPLKIIEAEMARYQPVHLPGMPPFTGGAVGFVGHEYVHYVEPTIQKPTENPLEVPILYYLITDSVVIFDHVRQVLRVCVNAHIEGDETVAYDRAVAEIVNICEQLTSLSRSRIANYLSLVKLQCQPATSPQTDLRPPSTPSKNTFAQGTSSKPSYRNALKRNLNPAQLISTAPCARSIHLPTCF